ncbi:uncharacterized protein BYT42DRAFT_593927 [Radiomyces spectabilis]|uniref:uncharacterized protein n=1 Tax=Radiomyces spectabilis TaxID=64574 RepID=UPI00222016C4|nr:uncharacterized protein BYT42DRAFT_593927 [Radiomyces spectabilis]KAI8377834.1 hypothetical protein BYT42DRAFT_593927 [Radiomyces spectabilis]
MSEALLFDQPIHFLKIDVEGFELPALESASRLYEKGLVENTVLEFGPPSRWDVTIEQREGMTPEQIRATTVKQAKTIMKRVVGEWDLDIYLLPAAGWDRTVAWMLEHQVDYSQDDPTKNKVVHRLKAWDFDGAAPEGDEFEAELNAKNQLVTEYIPLPPNLIDSYLDSLETIGEMYFWLVKRDSKNAIMQKFEL